MPESAPKFCKDCRWSSGSHDDADTLRCVAPKNVAVKNLVTGASEYAFKFCATHRSSPCERAPHLCGAEATWFEAKPESQF